ncbi:hypothetical protein TSAR_009120 [Trichomalopsis sarcophagae]|uniref:Uncharacterized protein n=1 Tax=Trichomalopsis sarcophagae TaxID=543379 RepID=A0A232EKL2_9HYME|nr:hypothetical protein TSAR_009120 [Trichomalopsis sarcophagae]
MPMVVRLTRMPGKHESINITITEEINSVSLIDIEKTTNDFTTDLPIIKDLEALLAVIQDDLLCIEMPMGVNIDDIDEYIDQLLNSQNTNEDQ